MPMAKQQPAQGRQGRKPARGERAKDVPGEAATGASAPTANERRMPLAQTRNRRRDAKGASPPVANERRDAHGEAATGAGTLRV